MIESSSSTDPTDSHRIETRWEYAMSLAQDGYQRIHVLSLADAGEVLTDRRIEIIEALRQNDYPSVRALARDLDRDQGAVSRDLSLLAEHGSRRWNETETPSGRFSAKEPSSSNHSLQPERRKRFRLVCASRRTTSQARIQEVI